MLIINRNPVGKLRIFKCWLQYFKNFTIEMRRKLLLYLLLTFILSVGGTGLIFSVWYNIVQMGFEDRQSTAILFVLLTVFQNLAIAVFTLPILFQVDDANYLKEKTRFLYLLASPVLVTIIFSYYFLSDLNSTITFAFVIAPLAFCIINAFFYNRLKRSRAENSK